MGNDSDFRSTRIQTATERIFAFLIESDEPILAVASRPPQSTPQSPPQSTNGGKRMKKSRRKKSRRKKKN